MEQTVVLNLTISEARKLSQLIKQINYFADGWKELLPLTTKLDNDTNEQEQIENIRFLASHLEGPSFPAAIDYPTADEREYYEREIDEIHQSDFFIQGIAPRDFIVVRPEILREKDGKWRGLQLSCLNRGLKKVATWLSSLRRKST